jgi:DNA-binding NarL/FixJ family response regulator
MAATDPGNARDVQQPIRVLIVDDHPHIRASLGRLLETSSDVRCVGAAEDGESAPELCKRLTPKVVLMDLRLPGIDGVEATRRVMAVCPDVRILVLTSVEATWMFEQAIEAGAVGYLLKDEPIGRIIEAIRSAALEPARAA